MINVKEIIDVKIEGINTKDYPDFVDAFISSAYWKNGAALTDEELNELNDNHTDFVYEHVMKSLHG